MINRQAWQRRKSVRKTGTDSKVPSNANAATPPEAPKLADIKLIDYDFAKYGSSDERSRLLERWDAEVGSLAN